MFALYAGRLKLRYELLSRQWIADVIVGPRKEQSATLGLGTQDLQVAKEAAIRFYRHFKQTHASTRPGSCWNCQQYSPQKRCCLVGIPECRKSGGRFSTNCELFVPIKD